MLVKFVMPKQSVIITRSMKKRGNKKDESESESELDSNSESELSISDDDESTVYTDITDEKKSSSSYEESVNERKRKRSKFNPNKYEDDEEEVEEDDVETEQKMLKTLYKLYPSKYMKQRIDNMKQRLEHTSVEHKKSNKRTNKKSKIEEPENNEDEDEDDSDYEEETATQKKNFNIVLTIGGAKGATSSNSVQEGDDAPYEDDENEELDTDDEQTFMRENYEKIVTPTNRSPTGMNIPKNSSRMSLEEIDEVPVKEHKSISIPPKKSNKTNKHSSNKEDTIDEFPTVDVEEKYKEVLELKKVLAEKLRKKPGSDILIKAIQHCNKKIRKMIRKARIENAKTYYNLINVDTNTVNGTDEISYFKKQLSNKEQIQVVKDLKKIHEEILVEKPYRLKILQSQMPAKLKAVVFQKLALFEMMDPSMDSEYYKMRTWIDTFMRIPFGIYKNLNIKMSDGLDASNDFMMSAKQSLDKYVYGLNDAKTQVMQMMGQWISNPSSLGTAIAIHGPPGTAKTTLVKEGISRTLGREFAFIALGGAGDSSFLEGHSYTYEGSSWGRIVQILIESKCMNPVIYFDELDKVSDTPRGEEIIGILTHLTDTSQNSQFHDKYFNGIDFDLSKCLFIFSYNDESKVNPILKDRMYRIKTQGYSAKDKIVIARKHLLPKIREQVNFDENDVVIGDDVLSHIIENQAKGEEGVRNLKRTLEIIHTKLNLYRLVKNGEDLFDKEGGIGKVVFPYTVTKRDVDRLVKVEECISKSVLNSMYV